MISQNQPSQVNNTSNIPINVAVVVGSDDPDKRPYCYWQELLKQLNPWGVEAVLRPNIPRSKAFQVIIINWDVANGSHSYESQVLKDFGPDFRTQVDDWVKDGGILFCEVQSVHGIPVQESYTAIFGSQIKVLHKKKQRKGISNEYNGNAPDYRDKPILYPGPSKQGYETFTQRSRRVLRGSVALVNKRHSKHPLVYGIHPFILSQYSYADERILPRTLREDRSAQFSLYYRCPETLYSGWFVDWGSDWVPVFLESASNKWPVLLVRTYGKGAWVASTIRLTSASDIPFIRNLVSFPIYQEQWREYHDRVLKRRRIFDYLSMVLLLLILILIASVIWKLGVVGLVIQYGSFFMTLFGLSVVGVLLAAYGAAEKYRNRRLR